MQIGHFHVIGSSWLLFGFVFFFLFGLVFGWPLVLSQFQVFSLRVVLLFAKETQEKEKERRKPTSKDIRTFVGQKGNTSQKAGGERESELHHRVAFHNLSFFLAVPEILKLQRFETVKHTCEKQTHKTYVMSHVIRCMTASRHDN